MKKIGKKVVKHLKEDMKEEKGEMKREKKGLVKDKELMKSIKEAHKAKSAPKKAHKIVKDAKHASKSKGKGKVSKVMHEFAEGKLHSGSKKGPKVSSKAKALAIGYSEAKKAKKKK